MRRALQLLVSAVLLSLVLAPGAQATHRWMSNGVWVHQHTRNFPTYYDTAWVGWEVAARDATLVWGQTTILEFPAVTSHTGSRIHHLSGLYGETGWAGLAEVNEGWNGTNGHYTHGHVYYNETYAREALATSAYPNWQHAIACQEVGHIIGLDHRPGGCMGLSYFPDAGSHYYPGPTFHDLDEINLGYPATGH